MRIVELFLNLPKPHRVLLAGLCVVMFLSILSSNHSDSVSAHSTSLVLDSGIRYPIALDTTRFEEFTENTELQYDTWKSVTVKPGDTLAKIFKRVGLTPKETYLVTQAGELAKSLTTIRPGEQLDYIKSSEGKLQRLRYELSNTKVLFVDASDDFKSYSTLVTENPIEIRSNFAFGQIESSFWNAGIKAGLTDNLIMRLAGIFGWDIDFAIELRKGDMFNVVFEEHYIDGDFVGYGDIIAAEFINQGDTFQAVMHTDGNYYTPEGRSMRKSFLRAPVDFRYVSSNFKKARFHPVQKRWKAHRGTDYVAAVGTPVMAAGDGKVIRAGYDKFNGHHVFIQHGEKYTTKYLHFKKRAVKKGDWVKQGQTVGYLGSTGMVTGAHLHYEFLVDGVHRNPRTVTLPKAQPIAKNEKAAFDKIAERRLQDLNASKNIMTTIAYAALTE
ncbi:peptidoglycan DD-metalloendopeptidase family protein [Alteromonas sp. 5E99-2]|uniref:OapA family protein n=1 Tax=Alteromonas sp. 5E99-2 TaxID=2817683 RepID=UPI001A9A2198|nr:peptidoglycan DD-metalloendopeptidase family protein [Alteromonas sp. 5E99-2]MBO1256345.1 peptidoglycan DD-metalloendopeptidase family protein [Alteromonas sp. 5E99-2]